MASHTKERPDAATGVPEELRPSPHAIGTEVLPLHLVLCLTEGMSLAAWERAGLLERESAIYRALQHRLPGLSFVTDGDRSDRGYSRLLGGITVFCNRWNVPSRWYERWVGLRLLSHRYPRIVVKSNQIRGADRAFRIARQVGGAFIARCGYLLSDNMIRAHGAQSHEVQSAMALEREVFSHADHVVVTTPRIRARVLELYRVPTERLSVIPNYVDVSRFAPCRDVVRNPRRLCYVGRLDPEKNPVALIRAIAGLDIELVMVGNGSLRKVLEAEAEHADVSVRFLGNVPNPNLPAILNSATAFVMPSLLEGHPKALLEAMACGLPVVGTNVQGIRELIRHRETGYVAECTVEGLRGAIREVLADRALQARMGTAARAYVERHCSLEMVVSMEHELLQDILHRP